MTSDTSAPRLVPLRKLGRSDSTAVDWRPDADWITDLVARLDLSALRKARISGRLHPVGAKDWRLEATLGATVVQPCAITLAPVTTRIDVPVARLFTEAYAEPTETEAESPEDDSIEPLPDQLDLGALFDEALALAVPDFPRAPDAEWADTSAAPPGVAPLTQEDVSPFAALAALKTKDSPET